MPAKKIITVSGLYSGIGKTLLSERILGLAPGAAAIKVTINDAVTEVLDDEASIMVPGKDTWRLKRSGAGLVIWVRARESDLPGALADAIARCKGFDRLLIEGNSVLGHVRPDLALFVCDSRICEDRPLKPSRVLALSRADMVINNMRPGLSAAEDRVENVLRRYNISAALVSLDITEHEATEAALRGQLLSRRIISA